MERKRRRRHLRLVKCDHSGKLSPDPEQEILDALENLEELEFQILTGAPDWTIAIDRRAPLEVKLRVLAAAKSYTLGKKSMDYLLRECRKDWEKELPAGD